MVKVLYLTSEDDILKTEETILQYENRIPDRGKTPSMTPIRYVIMLLLNVPGQARLRSWEG